MTTSRDSHRSYKARQGRISELTARTIDELWPRFGVGPQPGAGSNPTPGVAPPVDLAELFSDSGVGTPPRVVVELGSGMGDATVTMADADRTTAILAVEVHLRGIARLMRAAEERGVTNVRVAACDGQALLAGLPEASLVGVRAYFPDPWPKARHHKRRLVRPAFTASVSRVLSDNGVLHLATDWVDYAEQMRDVLNADGHLIMTETRADGFVDRPPWRPVTRYEQFGLDKGHQVYDLMATRMPRHP